MTAYLFNDPNCAFVRVRKTASVSVMNAFFKKARARCDAPLPNKEMWTYERSFAFVRDPLERFKSCLAMFYERGRVRYEEYQIPLEWRQPSVEQVLDLVADDRYKCGNLNYLENLKIHAIPMTHRYYALDRVEKIFRYEVLDTEWENLADYLCVDVPVMLYTNTAKTKVEITKAEEEMIKESYAEDYREFGY